MREEEIIHALVDRFPRHADQLGAAFECDAEIVRVGDDLWALTLDEFSPEEDRFTAADPRALGANLATATLSDLLAAGAAPAWFMSAIAFPRTCDEAFVTGLSCGISEVLDAVGCALCGGDVSTAESWRFSGFAMGRVIGNRPLTHLLPHEAQTLWISGPLGDANIAVLTGQPTPRFELRLAAARLIRAYGSACIDTSSGFLDALWLLHSLNPALRFTIDLARVPLAPGVRDAADALGFPPEAALLGGAGEYELLFTIPATVDEAAVAELSATGAVAIGEVAPCAIPGVHLCREGLSVGEMTQSPPCPRGVSNLDEYIRQVMQMARELVRNPGGARASIH